MKVPLKPSSSAVLDPVDPAELAAFDLDVRVTVDAEIGYVVRRCDSSDTCGSTCASACASN
jgi:FxLD family lantipeptide